MAVYHLKVSIGSRAGGQSAGAKSDYIEREGKYRQKDPEELEHSESGNMPEWAQENPHEYWQAADDYERANGRLYREVQFALPKEFDAAERREVSAGFAERLTGGEKLPFTLAIHRGAGENPHAHLMFSERVNDGIPRSAEQWFKRYNGADPAQGGARKSRAAMPQEWLERTRQEWAQTANEALGRGGHGERIDHRSLAERRDEAERAGDLEGAAELSRQPGVHLGPMGLRELPNEEPSGANQKAGRVERDNQKLQEERREIDREIEAKGEQIGRIQAEIQRVDQAIRDLAKRIAEQARGYLDRGSGFFPSR